MGLGDVSRARRLYASFTGRQADRAETLTLPALPDALACVGEIVAVEYVAERDGEIAVFRHVFEKARPLMCVFPDGKKVLMLGGAWKFTEDGYIDRA